MEEGQPSAKRQRQDDDVAGGSHAAGPPAESKDNAAARSGTPAAHLDGILAASNARELLQRQIDALDTLYGIYKVEQYALLEEMRMEHSELHAQGKRAVKESRRDAGDATGAAGAGSAACSSKPAPAQGAAPSGAPQAIRAAVLGKRAKPGLDQGALAPEPGPAQGPLDSQAPSAVKFEPAAPASAAAPHASPAKAGQAHHDAVHSPPGVSLNMWMAPGSAAAPGGTPQSLRQPEPRSAPQPAPAAQHPSGPASGSAGAREQAEGKGENPTPAVAADRQAMQTLGRPSGVYGDEALGYGSEDDPAAYSDVEGDVVRAQGAAGDLGREHAAAWRSRFADKLEEVKALEALASACTQQDLDAGAALASLSGRAGRFLICRPTVLIGRGSETKGGVDVDLAALLGGGPASAARVSRRQAFVSLQPDGGFCLENVGRRQLHVDGVEVAQFCRVPLRHLSLLELGGASLLFMVNQAAVQRVIRRTAKLVV